MSRMYVDMAGKRLPLSNLEKDLYPAYGFTKARVQEYYGGIAAFMLPHLKDRAVTFTRYPEGVGEEPFFEKRCPSHRPPWVRTADVDHGGKVLTFCVINDVETLLWAGNLAALELHVPLARAGSPDTPDSMVFDLDPGEGAGLAEAGRVALILRDLLAGMGLVSFVKTSGRKGLHVLVPLNYPGATFEDTKTFSRTVAGIMEKHYPGLVTARMAKQDRRAKIFINWSQNDASKTMISVYSLRGSEKPFVSFPRAWSEVEEFVAQGHREVLQVTANEAVLRAERFGDLFQDVLVKEQRLPHV